MVVGNCFLLLLISSRKPYTWSPASFTIIVIVQFIFWLTFSNYLLHIKILDVLKLLFVAENFYTVEFYNVKYFFGTDSKTAQNKVGESNSWDRTLCNVTLTLLLFNSMQDEDPNYRYLWLGWIKVCETKTFGY